jgi:RNA polymerase sigma-70 factor (ECF subfamily)
MPETTDLRTDQELVVALNSGDSTAFDVLYHRYSDWVLKMAWRLTRHEDDSLDVLQETFAYLVRKFPGFELTSAMTTFLYPAVQNLSIAARRKRQRSTGGSAVLDEIPQSASSAPAVHEDIASVLASLTDDHRAVLLLKFVDDLNQSEIAERLGLPLGTVKSRLHHAVRAVRESPTARKLLE